MPPAATAPRAGGGRTGGSRPRTASALLHRSGSAAIVSDNVSRKVAIGAAWLVAWRMVTRLLGIASMLIMARILAPADYGVLGMATTLAATIDALSQFGVQEALIRREAADERLHDTAFTLQLGRALVTAALLCAGAPAAGAWFNEPRLLPILLVLGAASAVSGLQNIGVVAFRRDIDYNRQFLLLCVPRLLQVATTIPLGLVLHSYWALVLGTVTSRLAQVVMSYGMHPYRPRVSIACWRELAGFSLWTWAASLAAIIWNRCDPFVIGPAVGAAQLGLFLLATEIAGLPVTELIAPVSEVLLGGFSLAQRAGDSPLASAMSVATALLFAIMPMVLALSGTAGFIVAALLGARWTAAAPLIGLAAWLGVFAPYSFVCSTALVSAGRVRNVFVANAIASLIKLTGLAAVVARTTDLAAITLASVAIVGLEALVFLIILAWHKKAALAETAKEWARLCIVSGLTLLVMRSTGLAWRPVSLPPWPALATGAALGCGIVGVFVALAFLVWRLAGQPDGAETKAANLLRQAARPMWRRARACRQRITRRRSNRSMAEPTRAERSTGT